MNKNKEKFFDKYSDLNHENYKLELLWSQKIIHGKLHRIRSNLTKIIWIIVASMVIFIISVLLYNLN